MITGAIQTYTFTHNLGRVAQVSFLISGAGTAKLSAILSDNGVNSFTVAIYNADSATKTGTLTVSYL